MVVGVGGEGGGGREGAQRAREVLADDVELGREVAALVVQAEGELPDEGERDGPAAFGMERRSLAEWGKLAVWCRSSEVCTAHIVTKTGNVLACRLRQLPANRISTTQFFAHGEFIDSNFGLAN